MPTEACEREENRIVRAVSHLVERMLWKIADCDKEKQDDYLLKFFKFLWTQKDLATIGEKLIQYRAKLEAKELQADIAEEEIEDKETDLDDMFE